MILEEYPEDMPLCKTVGDLMDQLAHLPRALPLNTVGMDDPGYRPVVVNASHKAELMIEDADGF